MDTIAKPIENQTRHTLSALNEELVSKVRVAASARIGAGAAARERGASGVLAYRPSPSGLRHVIAIGSSTGGVEALRDIFLRLPALVPPIVITQHMPPTFTASFAARLNTLSQVEVREAHNHDRLEPGHAYIAPGGLHMKIVRVGGELVCKLEDTPPVSSHKPSVDVLFYSVAEAIGARAVGVILTGMGKDGAAGLKAMRDAGAYTIGQNQASCVVYGMPQAAAKIGACQIELSLSEIPAHMLSACEKGEKAA